MSTKNKGVAAFVLAFLAAILHSLFQRNRRKNISWLTNKTNIDIWFKPEEGTKAASLASNTATISKIDGFAFNGKIYKVSDGTTVTINEDSTITYSVVYADVLELVAYPFRTKPLKSPPDEGWNDLFNKIK
ncbi:hypothetical protein SAMN05421780_1115 [Flexibacter flexilis DSM 6793]|uniref:Uncharacterized protein n=1 Tax=Flexibacter flexilis DSM 6793 TaxID=927664 RepID=A0A1I1MNE6_9BACT|nr:hypothetical protein [Flexibacter flexilis]SFC86665.1 hypothetical protein SAMN05421780_1115 [Flexibacter flexilis DSM 6793]